MRTEIIRVLRELEHGAEVPSGRLYAGICNEVWMRITPRIYSDSRLFDVFRHLGLDPQYPVGGFDEWIEEPNLWEGFRGDCRRYLAGCVADVLEHGGVTRCKLERLRHMLNVLAQDDGRVMYDYKECKCVIG